MNRTGNDTHFDNWKISEIWHTLGTIPKTLLGDGGGF